MEKDEDQDEKEKENSSEDEGGKESEEENKDEIKEDVNEDSDGEKGQEEKTIGNPKVEETEKVGEGDREKENKQLKKVFFIIGLLSLFFIGIFLFVSSIRQFTYEGLDFEVVKEGKIILYRTSLPVNSQHKVTGGAVFADYNFYLRTDPRKLKNLPIEGELTLMKNAVINFTEDFKCGGKGIIAVANIMNVLDVLDVTLIKDEIARCDYSGTYTFLRLQTGNETSIEQFGPSCYNFNINNCEVLEVTEKYIVELLSEVTKNRL